METAYLLLRVALGLNILMHGVTRLASGVKNFRQSLVDEFKNTSLPPGITKAFATLLPYIETSVGLLMIIGLLTNLTLLAGSLLMLMLLFGKSLKSDWQTVTFQMIYIFLYAVLLAFQNQNTISLDKF